MRSRGVVVTRHSRMPPTLVGVPHQKCDTHHKTVDLGSVAKRELDRRCWPSQPDLGERWPSRLVATEEKRRRSGSLISLGLTDAYSSPGQCAGVLFVVCLDVALLGPREMSDLSPQSEPKRTLIKRAEVPSTTSAVTCRCRAKRGLFYGAAFAHTTTRGLVLAILGQVTVLSLIRVTGILRGPQ